MTIPAKMIWFCNQILKLLDHLACWHLKYLILIPAREDTQDELDRHISPAFFDCIVVEGFFKFFVLLYLFLWRLKLNLLLLL